MAPPMGRDSEIAALPGRGLRPKRPARAGNTHRPGGQLLEDRLDARPTNVRLILA